MKGMISKKNKPVATLIKQYCDKQSGKVSEARRELHWRFGCLDWTQQKKIIMAHLESCASDREWIYPRLLRLWDKAFEPKIKELWETYKEPRCSWLVVRHLPETYVMEHLGELSNGRNYYFICLRFGAQKDFVVDKENLAPVDYLTVMDMTHREITDEDALQSLYRVVLHELLHPTYDIINHRHRKMGEPSLNLVRNINQGMFCLRMMQKENCLAEFERWDAEVSKLATSKLQESKTARMSDHEYNLKVYSILMDSAAELLPKEYKNSRVNDWKQQNPLMASFVEQLDLEEAIPEVTDWGPIPF